jgi:hypothetical protein
MGIKRDLLLTCGESIMKNILCVVSALFFIISNNPVWADVIFDFVPNDGQSFDTAQENVMASIIASDVAVAAGSAGVTDSSVLITLTARMSNNQGVSIDLTEADLHSMDSDHILTFSGDRLTISGFSMKAAVPAYSDAWWLGESLGINSGLTDIDHIAHLRANSIFLESLASSVGGEPSLFVQSIVEGTWSRRNAVEVAIDIEPGNDTNNINPGLSGSTRVAVLSNTVPAFDPMQIDITSVRFGPGQAEVLKYKVKDINKDGLADYQFRFSVPDTGITCGGTEATLTGELFGGETAIGTDVIVVVGC